MTHIRLAKVTEDILTGALRNCMEAARRKEWQDGPKEKLRYEDQALDVTKDFPALYSLFSIGLLAVVLGWAHVSLAG